MPESPTSDLIAVSGFAKLSEFSSAISRLPLAPTLVLMPVISGAVDRVNHA